MTEKLEIKMREVITDLIANNASAIAQELQENPEGKLAVSMGIQLNIVARKVYVAGKLGYSRKFSDEANASFETDDPAQLPLSERDNSTVQITQDGKAITEEIPLKKFSEAVKKLTAER